jgi:hypothetical protein
MVRLSDHCHQEGCVEGIPFGRYRLMAGLGAVALVLAVVAAIVLSSDDRSAKGASPATGPFTGTFTVAFGPVLTGAGTPPDQENAPSSSDAVPSFTEPWRLRSACAANGCVATASTGGQYPASDIVFDDVGGRWVAVATSRGQCSGSDAERWDVVSVQAQADGHLSGEWTQVTSNGCFRKRTATFTRVGDADITTLADPAAQPPRVVSPAEALHGAYHSVTKYAGRSTPERYDSLVRTDCLRAGDRCMSEFLDPEDGTGTPLIFASGAWTLTATYDNKCSLGTPTQVKNTATFQLPKPAQNPIPRLAGRGFSEWTGCPSTAYDETFTRTGD